MMIIAGAGGHAKEILDILKYYSNEEIVLFDNTSANISSSLHGFKIVNNLIDLKLHFEKDKRFIVGVGNSAGRKKLFELFIEQGGYPYSIIAENAYVSESNTTLGSGLNIMQLSFISCDVEIGNGVLINTRANIHHNVSIGEFTEIGPGATLLGGVSVGDLSLIGAGAVILPGLKIGSHCKIGAGAVVTKNVSNNQIVKGNPAR